MIENVVQSRRDFMKTAGLIGASLTLGGIVHPGMSYAANKSFRINNSTEYPPIITKKRTLGKGNYALEVPAIELGCMGMQGGRGLVPGEPAMQKLIRQSVERGYNFLDTAEGYSVGQNEILLGRAISSIRDKVIISTKFSGKSENGQLINDNRPQRIREACEGSLKRLNVETIDLYIMHRIDRSVPIEDVAGTVGKLIDEGKVRYFGLSEVAADTIRRAHSEYPVTAIQSEYHLMFRKPEELVFPVLEELGIGFVAYSPLNRGFLGGNLNEYSDVNTNDIRGSWPQFKPEAIRSNTRIVEVLNEFGKTRGMTSSQIALSWMLSKYPYVLPLIGTTKLSHLEEDLRAVDFTLTTAEIKEIEDKISTIGIVGDRYDTFQQSRVEY